MISTDNWASEDTAQLYCAGPALFYVGIPATWNTVTQWIIEVQQQGLRGFQPPSAGDITAEAAIEFAVKDAQVVNAEKGKPNLQNNSNLQLWIDDLQAFYTPFYFGTSEGPPRIDIVPAWDGVESDAGGYQNPSERLTEGEEAYIHASFTRYNEIVYQVLAARSQPNAFAGQSPGWGSLGMAIALEKLIFPLWVVFPYTQKTVYGLGGQPAGYRFHQGFLHGPDRLTRGTAPSVTNLLFGAQRVVTVLEDPANLVQSLPCYLDMPQFPFIPFGAQSLNEPDQSWGGLYDFDVSGLPAPN